MRVVFFTDSFPPTLDGVARVTEPLARALVGRGVEVTVETVRLPGTPRSERTPEGIEVRRRPSVPAPRYPEYRIGLVPYLLPVAPSPTRGAEVAHLHTPGLVGLGGYLSARREGVPTVGTYHTNLDAMLRATPHGPAIRRAYRAWGRFARALCLGSDAPTAPTQAAADDLIRGSNPVEPPSVRIIGNGVETARFRPGLDHPDWRQRLALSDAPIVTYLGRLTRDKGLFTILDAVSSMPRRPKFELLIAGTGPLRPAVANRIGSDPRLVGRARFVGPVAESEKPALLAQTRLFLLPSVADTSSVAVLEAMASGATPIVTCRGGPAALVRPGRTGLVVDPEDPAKLAEAIEAALAHPDETEALGVRARSWVEQNASIDRTAEEFLRLYREVAAGPKGARARSRRARGSDRGA